jgi:uncharacterized protein (TIGR03086 family)
MPDHDRSVTELIEAGRDREAAALATHRKAPSMDPLTQLDKLAGPLGAVVGGITPADLDRRTPCADFTVRGVLEHMVGGATAFAAAFRGEAPATPPLADPLAEFGPALENLVAAVSAPGALNQTVAAPFGEIPGETFARSIVLDGLVHGWDMAIATGQPYDPPADLVADADAFARQALDPLRGADTFGPAVEPAPDATPIERLVNYTGRRA